VGHKLARYAQDRNHPDADGGSGLSPWLHFGHLSAHRIFDAVARAEAWTPDRLRGSSGGRREGFWRMSPSAEAFLDQLVTWRELGQSFAARRSDHAEYDALPHWALATLEAHAGDPRPHRYDLAELERSGTHDPLWNAAQRQLRLEGRLHGYLRMLWGKKILEWSGSPRQAAAAMLQLNDRWARRARSQLLQRHLLVPGPLRSVLGPGATHLRDVALHDQPEHGEEAEGEGVPRAVRGTGRAALIAAPATAPDRGPATRDS
jgi:deoxyribodipyrimidine photo-lyase